MVAVSMVTWRKRNTLKLVQLDRIEASPGNEAWRQSRYNVCIAGRFCEATHKLASLKNVMIVLREGGQSRFEPHCVIIHAGASKYKLESIEFFRNTHAHKFRVL